MLCVSWGFGVKKIKIKTILIILILPICAHTKRTLFKFFVDFNSIQFSFFKTKSHLCAWIMTEGKKVIIMPNSGTQQWDNDITNGTHTASTEWMTDWLSNGMGHGLSHAWFYDIFTQLYYHSNGLNIAVGCRCRCRCLYGFRCCSLENCQTN